MSKPDNCRSRIELVQGRWRLSENSLRVKHYDLSRDGSTRLQARHDRWNQLSHALVGLLNLRTEGGPV